MKQRMICIGIFLRQHLQNKEQIKLLKNCKWSFWEKKSNMVTWHRLSLFNGKPSSWFVEFCKDCYLLQNKSAEGPTVAPPCKLVPPCGRAHRCAAMQTGSPQKWSWFFTSQYVQINFTVARPKAVAYNFSCNFSFFLCI